MGRATDQLNDEKSESDRLDGAAAEQAFVAHAVEIERFLVGMLKDPALAADIVQTTFVRLIEKGGGVVDRTRRAWLFKVAYNEAMLSIRRGKVARRANEKLAWQVRSGENVRSLDSSLQEVLHAEDVEKVRAALDDLSPELRMVVHLRIYEGLKFADIAQRLEVPLGTVLTRMRNSLAKLRLKLNEIE
ncbi:MAG: RNA polymerase sigma factor [Mariniblastus sp.]|nr:RNA polymerase sigma factor [Mariniblastus sp.]